MVEFTKKGKVRQRGEHDHLYLRNGTYYFFYRYPKFWIDWWTKAGVPSGRSAKGARIEHSLKTSDYNEACGKRDLEMAQIRAELATFKSHMKLNDAVGNRIQWRQEPYGDRVDHGNGVFSEATDEFIFYVDVNGKPLRDHKTIPNASWEKPRRGKETTPEFEALRDHMFETLANLDPKLEKVRPKKIVPKLPRDDEIIEFYIRHQGLRKADADEARRALADFRMLNPGVTLEKATWERAASLCYYYQKSRYDDDGKLVWKKNSFKVARKKARYLSQALRFCGEKIDPPIARNIFAGASKRLPGEAVHQEVKRIALEDDESAAFVEHIGKMKPDLQTIAILVMTTGMRPAEAMRIEGEQRIGRFRCVTIGAKLTDGEESRKRTIPLPPPALAYLPSRIEGKLFSDMPLGDVEGMRYYETLKSKRMMRQFRKAVMNKRKVFYNFRHTAITKMAQSRVPPEIRLEIVGHEETDGVHRGYIHGESAYSKEELAHAMRHIWKHFNRDHLRPFDDLPNVLPHEA